MPPKTPTHWSVSSKCALQDAHAPYNGGSFASLSHCRLVGLHIESSPVQLLPGRRAGGCVEEGWGFSSEGEDKLAMSSWMRPGIFRLKHVPWENWQTPHGLWWSSFGNRMMELSEKKLATETRIGRNSQFYFARPGRVIISYRTTRFAVTYAAKRVGGRRWILSASSSRAAW